MSPIPGARPPAPTPPECPRTDRSVGVYPSVSSVCVRTEPPLGALSFSPLQLATSSQRLPSSPYRPLINFLRGCRSLAALHHLLPAQLPMLGMMQGEQPYQVATSATIAIS